MIYKGGTPFLECLLVMKVNSTTKSKSRFLLISEAIGQLFITKKELTETNRMDKCEGEARQMKETFQEAMRLLHEEQLYLNQNLKLSELAEKQLCSTRQLSRSVNSVGGTNFNTFINSFRVAHAREMLKANKYAHYKIEAIALECGFSNKVSFYKAFKSEMKMSPREFRASL